MRLTKAGLPDRRCKGREGKRWRDPVNALANTWERQLAGFCWHCWKPVEGHGTLVEYMACTERRRYQREGWQRRVFDGFYLKPRKGKCPPMEYRTGPCRKCGIQFEMGELKERFKVEICPPCRNDRECVICGWEVLDRRRVCYWHRSVLLSAAADRVALREARKKLSETKEFKDQQEAWKSWLKAARMRRRVLGVSWGRLDPEVARSLPPVSEPGGTSPP